MKTTFPIKFFGLLLIVFLFNKIAQAQINYTDVNPDITFSTNGSIYPLDLNNDGIVDFNITYTNAFAGVCSDIAHLNYHIRITPLNNNSIGNASSTPLFPKKSDANDIIDKSIVWSKAPNQLLFSMNWICQNEYWLGVANGNWINTNGSYLPLRLRIGGANYNGWLGIDIIGLNSSFGNFKIKDYAINTMSYLPILAGEISCVLPVVSLTPAGPIIFCPGDSAQITANSNAYKYQWRRDGINITDANSSTYLARNAGTYKVIVTNTCGSIASICKKVFTTCRTTGAEIDGKNINLIEANRLALFPNPSYHLLNIILPIDDESTVQIFSLMGELVFSSPTNATEMAIDVSDFTAGIYLIKWTNASASDTKLFSVVK